MVNDAEKSLLEYLDDHAQLILISCTPEGEILKYNAFSEKLIPGQLLRSRIDSIFITPDRNKVISRLFSANAQQMDLGMLSIITSSALPQTFFFRMHFHGKTVHLLGTPDLQEFEQFRRQILSLTNELSALSRELQKKNRELAQLNELKDQFLGMAAHDLRKPIGLIKMLSEFLVEEASDKLNNEHNEFVNKIFSSSAFMKQLVDDFLDVSRIESGNLTLDRTPVQVSEIVQSALLYVKHSADKKEIDITVDNRSRESKISVDRSKMEQVLINLLSNAIEHSNPGMKVNLEHIIDNGQVSITVKDSGVGIPPEGLEKLFDPYRKVGVAKTGNEKSTGLGLVIVKKIIESHNGKIECSSEVGRGTEFQITIPTEN